MPTATAFPFAAVVFDMDGVLVDSESVWQRIREAYAAELGERWTEADQRSVMGVSTPVWSGYMVERLAPAMAPAAMAAEIEARMRAAYARDLPMRPGAVDAVRHAAARAPTALASGSPRALVDHVVDASGLRDAFMFVISGDETRHGKPHPELYLRALAALDADAAQAVGIEDSHNGLLALRAAGMRAVAAPSPAFPLDAASLALADRHIDSMTALPAVLDGWPS